LAGKKEKARSFLIYSLHVSACSLDNTASHVVLEYGGTIYNCKYFRTTAEDEGSYSTRALFREQVARDVMA